MVREAPPPPSHRPAPTKGRVLHAPPSHRPAPRRSPRAGDESWVDYWATSTWPNWQPFRPNAPAQPPYELHEAARAGIRLMPDQGATIAGLRARVAELESRGRKLESTLRLEQQVKMLRRENARLREESSVPHQAQLKAEVTALRSENAFLKSHNLSIAAKLHAAEKALEAQGLDAGG